MFRLIRYFRGHWLRSIIRSHNRRMIERGYYDAVTPVPTIRKSLRGLLRVMPSDARWALALAICPEIREELLLR